MSEPITGYRQLDPATIAQINAFKALANDLGGAIDHLAQSVQADPTTPSGQSVDPRWLSIAKTHLQQGFMALTRAIAQPAGL